LAGLAFPNIHPGPLSLAIPSWVGAVSTGDGFGHCWGRNGEICVAVGPAAWTVGILAYCRPYSSLIGCNRHRLKGQGDELHRDGPHSLCINLLVCVVSR